MANANSAKDSCEKDGLKIEKRVTLTFTEVPGTQEVNANHKKYHNRDVDWHMLELISDDQIGLELEELPSHNSHWYPSM